jgi:hypothetical protein
MKPFSATCKMYDPTAERLRLTQEEYDAHNASGAHGRATFDYGTKMWNVEQRCSFSTAEVTELRAHLEAVHANKKRVMAMIRGRAAPTFVRINSLLPQLPMHPKWRGPALKDEGRPFAPVALDLGAEVEWEGRTGQVWCQGHLPKSAWVVPNEPSTQHRDELTRREVAVLLVERSYGYREDQTMWSSWTESAVA